MSLTSELKLKDSFTRCFIDTWCGQLPLVAAQRTKLIKALPCVPSGHKERWLDMVTGTAADYMIRHELGIKIHELETVISGIQVLQLFASVEVYFDGDQLLYENHWHKYTGIGGVAFNFISSYLELVRQLQHTSDAHSNDDLHYKYLFLFALLDCAGRSFFGGPTFLIRHGRRNTARMLEKVPDAVVIDLRNLCALFKKSSLSALQPKTVVSGVPLCGSPYVGGADFDFVADGTLYELKTSHKSAITTAMLRQALGYWLLDFNDQFRIRNLSIYLVRQGHGETFDIGELTCSADPYKLRQLFKWSLMRGRVPAMSRKFGLRPNDGREPSGKVSAEIEPVQPIDVMDGPRKPGRPAIFGRRMTSAETTARYRAKRRIQDSGMQ